MAKRRRMKDTRYDDVSKGGGSNNSFINWGIFKDKEISFYKPKDGANMINIIPFEIKSKLNPILKTGNYEIGDIDFVLEIWVHKSLGPNNVSEVCPKKNYGKSCPACEKYYELKDNGKEKDAEAFKVTQRAVFNIQPLIKGEPQPMQVFDISHYLFMKELREEANECSKGDNIVQYADIEKGKIIKFRATAETYKTAKYFKFKSFGFLDRDEELDENLIDEAVSFDEGIVLHTYEEIEKIMYGADDNTEEEEEEEKEETKEAPVKEEEKEEIDTEEVQNAGKNKKEEVPAKEEEKKQENTADTKCPHGFKWGTADDHLECKKCDTGLWDDCCDKV